MYEWLYRSHYLNPEIPLMSLIFDAECFVCEHLLWVSSIWNKCIPIRHVVPWLCMHVHGGRVQLWRSAVSHSEKAQSSH